MTPRKPRKMPKNQRAYPKKGKPRMVEVTNYPYLTQDPKPGLSLPHIIWDAEGRAWCKAGEFHKFMDTPAPRYQPTSTGEQ